MKIVGFGASSMRGASDSAGGFFTRLQRPTFAIPNAQWLNLGIGGNTTVDMLRRMDAVLAAQPTHLVVILGCNDLPRTPDGSPDRRTDLETYGRNVDTILRTIRAPWSLFITSFAVCERRTGIAPATLDAYMAAATQAARINGYRVWDLQAETRDSVQQYWANDGLHFDDHGHELIAQHVAKLLNEASKS